MQNVIADYMRADSPVPGHSAEWYFFRSYVGAALWSSNDESDENGGEPMDSNYDISDLSPDCLESMLKDCAAFYAANLETIHAECEDFEGAARAAGWTRNWHNGYFVAPIGSEVRIAEFESWQELCEANDIEPLSKSPPLANDFEGSIAAREAAMAGHDFWLTRCRHGAGFWDGDWPEPAATILDNAAKAFGNADLYIGDGGKVCLS
ncbi:hypothetical protein [Manganibacter manganicus]|uniref:Uncharacterized protein n=1 Tax=Manganibacter manganicus TaxID=1873176 RepID=A0A1V8RP10_9HYPH|nr:hypothetical protein [Pseudaminobacter manganicus]OQM74930.1 hypothetical protein BFN67_04765 [Pseudaminobacter manganicus]